MESLQAKMMNLDLSGLQARIMTLNLSGLQTSNEPQDEHGNVPRISSRLYHDFEYGFCTHLINIGDFKRSLCSHIVNNSNISPQYSQYLDPVDLWLQHGFTSEITPLSILRHLLPIPSQPPDLRPDRQLDLLKTLITLYHLADKHQTRPFKNAVLDEYILRVYLLGDKLDPFFRSVWFARPAIAADTGLFRVMFDVMAAAGVQVENEAAVAEWPYSGRLDDERNHRQVLIRTIAEGRGALVLGYGARYCERYHDHGRSEGQRRRCLKGDRGECFDRLVVFLGEEFRRAGREGQGLGAWSSLATAGDPDKAKGGGDEEV